MNLFIYMYSKSRFKCVFCRRIVKARKVDRAGQILKNCAERREARKILGYFVWNNTILRQKILFFSNFRRGACRVRPPLDPPGAPLTWNPGSAPGYLWSNHRHKHHLIVLDNAFTSPVLCHDLYRHDIYVTGTARVYRKGMHNSGS
jgi:hypothetical protein